MSEGVTAPGTKYTIANITDFHGRLDSGVAERMACYVDENPDAYLTSSGDNIGATLFISSAQDDRPTMDALNAMGVKVSALGNHELDKGWEDFDMKSGWADFDYIAANISGDPVKGLNEDGYVMGTIGDLDVAFVGAVTPLLPELISPSILTGVTLDPIATSVNAIADELKDSGEADLVIALVHEDPNVYIGDLSTNVDAVFGGHSHLLYDNGKTVPTIGLQAASYGTHVAELDLLFDTEGNLTFDTELVPLASINLADCTGPVHEEVAQIVADAAAEAEEIGSQELGYIADDFNRAFTAPGNENRGEESTVGSLVADAQLWAAQDTPAGADAVMSFMNPGGLRTDLKYDQVGDGLVTLGMAATMQPFANTLFAMDLTGADVIQVLNEQLQPAGSSRPYLHLGVAGLTFQYDPETYEVTGVTLDSGEELDPAANYRIVTNSFLKDGGDNFPAFTKGTNVQDTGLVDLDAFIDFMGANSSEDDPLDPNGDVYGPQRGFGVADVSDDGLEEIVAGQEIALDYAGLWYTNGESSNVESLELLLGGTSLGTFEVTGDQADLDLKMTNYGRAEVRATIPNLDEFAGEDVALQVVAGDQVLSEFTYSIPDGTTDPTDPTDPTDFVPVEADLDPALEDAITVPKTASPGDTIPVGVPTEDPGTEIQVWMFSDPVALGTRTLDSASATTVTIPADAPLGDHKIAVYSADGEQVGWAPIELIAATDEPTDGTTTPPTDGATTPPTDGSTTTPGGTTPDTGANVGGPLVAAMLLLGAGAVFLGARRRMSA